ncbi:MAG: cupredoxin domain-containing protein [archaeon]
MEIKQLFVILAACMIFVVTIVAARNIISGNTALPQSNTRTVSNNYQNAAPSAAPSPSADGVQDVKLSMRGFTYILEPSTLKKGVPVRMTVDLSKVTGCMTDVTIPAFGVRKLVKNGDNVITFTPDKAGTFNIACSMNMGRGQFTVVESDGSKADYVEAAPAGGSCGSGSGGGCGCGGGIL